MSTSQNKMCRILSDLDAKHNKKQAKITDYVKDLTAITMT